MNILKKTKLAMAITAFAGITAVSTANAIQVTTDGAGRILLAPIVIAVGGGGQESIGNNTVVTVTNTDVTRAVKAHLALKSEKASDETFDFIIYLSPGDVFRGEFYTASDGNTVLFKTSDDSIKFLGFVGATDEPPFVGDPGYEELKDFVVPTDNITHENDTINISHIQVTSIYSVTGTVKAAKIKPSDSEEIKIERGMAKRDLRRIFDMTTEGRLAINGCSESGADGDKCSNMDAVSSHVGILRGNVELKMATGSANYAMTGLVDSDEDMKDGITCEATYCEKVNANPFYDHTSAEIMLIGDNMGTPISPVKANHNLYNIERALSEGVYNGIYAVDKSHRTLVLSSLPTRYMHENGNDYCSNIGEVVNHGVEAFTSPFTDIGVVPYHQFVYNETERWCNLVPDPIKAESVTLAESGSKCSDLGGEFISSLNPDGTLLCTKIDISVPTIFERYLTFEVEGIPVFCGDEEFSKEWFGEFPNGWYQMKLEETNGLGGACNYGGVPATMTTIRMDGDLRVTGLIPTSH
jgi:hypothetical protein